MSQFSRSAFFAALALCAGAGPVSARVESIGASLVYGDPAQIAVVGGEVVALHEDADKATWGVVKITHVYSGPKSLKGLAVFDPTAQEVFSNNGSIATPLLKVKETGIWTLCISQVSETWVVSGRRRKDHDAHYDRWVEWAEAIGKLSALKVPERLELARELFTHKTPEVAWLAAEVLLGATDFDAKQAGVPEYLAGLPKNRDASTAAVARVDYLSYRGDREKWLASDRHKALIDRLTEPLTDAEAEYVFFHIEWCARMRPPQGMGNTTPEAVALLGKIAADPRQPKSVRAALLKHMTRGGAHRGIAFDVFVAAVRDGDDAALRLSAAEKLAQLPAPRGAPAYTPAQIEVVRALLKSEKDAAVAKALTAALDRGK